jgi:succinate dehydrogenase / fumarate reductase cytochrome b subunit
VTTAMEGSVSKGPSAPDHSSRPSQMHFWLRRVHSLAGIAFGGFVAFHLTVNATTLNSVVYQQEVNDIHALGPNLGFVEFTFIFLPLLIHVLYGLYITGKGARWNAVHYNYGGNYRYTLQRISGLILLVFLAYHLATLHRWGLALIYDLTHWSALSSFPWFHMNQAYTSTVDAIKTPYSHNPWFWANVLSDTLYLLGVWAAVYHLANGLWTAAIAWGLTITAQSQRRWGNVCVGIGVVVGIIGTIAWLGVTVLGKPGPLMEKNSGVMVQGASKQQPKAICLAVRSDAYSLALRARTEKAPLQRV